MITIWLPDDRPTLAMRVFGSTFVEEIKAQIEIESGIPQDEQRLATGRHSLLDGKTMRDYNITDGTRLRCMLSIQGGGKVGNAGVKKQHLKESNAANNSDRKLLLEARVKMSLNMELPQMLHPLQEKIRGIFDTKLYLAKTIELADSDMLGALNKAFAEHNSNGNSFGRGLTQVFAPEVKWLAELTRVMEDAHELAYFREFWSGSFDTAGFKKLLDDREKQIEKGKLEVEITQRIAAALTKDKMDEQQEKKGDVQ